MNAHSFELMVLAGAVLLLALCLAVLMALVRIQVWWHGRFERAIAKRRRIMRMQRDYRGEA